jgi:GT2 family glycosyltransferase
MAILSAWEQTVLPDEIVIADDGSREETAELVRTMKKESGVPIIHTWQPDDGFRVALARNNAVAASTGEYLIFLDGDCYMHKYFIEDHLSYAERGYYVCGRRVQIGYNRKEYILRTGDRRITFFSGGTSKRLFAIRSHWLAKFYRKWSAGRMKVSTANMAVWRSDFVKVNGFNVRLAGWGGEDQELGWRLDAVGVVKKEMGHLGIAYHFRHLPGRRLWKHDYDLLHQCRAEEKERCRIGLNRALEEGVTILR